MANSGEIIALRLRFVNSSLVNFSHFLIASCYRKDKKYPLLSFCDNSGQFLTFFYRAEQAALTLSSHERMA